MDDHFGHFQVSEKQAIDASSAWAQGLCIKYNAFPRSHWAILLLSTFISFSKFKTTYRFNIIPF